MTRPPPKQKAVRPWQGETAFKNYWQANFTPLRRAQQQGRIEVDAVLAVYLVLLGAMFAQILFNMVLS
ncbi:MAG: hypothetical protein KJZ92_04885 [Rhodocyclaceae bacterium]|nr:hypothetical protein [Rhodocyclaceae bacterium]